MSVIDEKMRVPAQLKPNKSIGTYIELIEEWKHIKRVGAHSPILDLIFTFLSHDFVVGCNVKVRFWVAFCWTKDKY
jgi:hypothetical protein